MSLVVVPLGGGGLIAGIGLALAARLPDARVVGVQAEACAPYIDSLAAHKPIGARSANTICDGIAVKRPGDFTLPLVERHVDEVVTVSDDQVAEAMVLLLERSKLVVEGAGAVAVAALMHDCVKAPDEGEICAVLSGGNVDASLLSEAVRLGETYAGRRMVISTVVPDRPGALAGLLAIVADHGGNVVDVEHLRDGIDLHVRETAIKLVLQTSGPDCNEAILDAARGDGFALRVEKDAVGEHLWLTCLLAMLTFALLGAPARGEPGLRKSLSMTSINQGGDADDLTALDNLELVQQTGARWVRLWIRWDKAQPLPPAFVPWSALDSPANDLPDCGTGCGYRYIASLDAQIAAARAAGLNVVLVSWLFPRWANGTAGRPADWALEDRGTPGPPLERLKSMETRVPVGRTRARRPLRALDRLARRALCGLRPQPRARDHERAQPADVASAGAEPDGGPVRPRPPGDRLVHRRDDGHGEVGVGRARRPHPHGGAGPVGPLRRRLAGRDQLPHRRV